MPAARSLSGAVVSILAIHERTARTASAALTTAGVIRREGAFGRPRPLDGVPAEHLQPPLDDVRWFTRREDSIDPVFGHPLLAQFRCRDAQLIELTPQGTRHSESVARLSRLLTRALPDRYVVRTHSPFAATDDSEPEPDLAVVPDEDYSTRHPSTAFLIVEVADSSRAKDLGPKARLYATAGIPEYWLVDLVDDVVLVHLRPEGGRYASVEAHRAGEVLKPTALPQVEVPVVRLLP